MVFILLKSFLTGYAVSAIGFLMGGSLLKIINNKVLYRCMLSFSGGLLLSLVCFKVLPQAFFGGYFYAIMVSMLVGVFAAAILEKIVYVNIFKIKNINEEKSEFKIWRIIAFGLTVHNFLLGFILGADFAQYYYVMVFCFFHFIHQGYALKDYFGKNEIKEKIYLKGIICLSLGAALGSFIGSYMFIKSDIFVRVFLAFSGGALLYVSSGEMIMETNELKKIIYSSIGSLLGFVIGTITIFL